MLLHFGLQSEFPRTEVTLVRILAHMQSHVLVQLGTLSESSVAIFADVWLFAGVAEMVAFKMRAPVESFRAFVTFEGSFPAMDFHVSLHCRSGGEGCAARFANVLPFLLVNGHVIS